MWGLSSSSACSYQMLQRRSGPRFLKEEGSVVRTGPSSAALYGLDTSTFNHHPFAGGPTRTTQRVSSVAFCWHLISVVAALRPQDTPIVSGEIRP